MRVPHSLPPSATGVFAVLQLLPRVSQRFTFWLAASVLLLSALPLAFTVVTGLVVGSIVLAVRDGIGSASGHHAMALLSGAMAIILVQRVLTPFVATGATVFGRKMDLYLQQRVITAVSAPSGVAHLEDPTTLDLLKTAQGIGGQGAKPGDAVSSLVNLIPRWIQSLGSAVILLWFHWWLGVVWLVLWPVILAVLQHEYIRVGEVAGGHADAVRRADYYRDLALLPEAGKEVRILGLASWVAERFDTTWRRNMQPIWDARDPIRPVIWLSAAVVAVASAATFGLLAHDAITGGLSLGALALFTRATLDAGSFAAFDDVNTRLVYAAVAVPALLTLESRLESRDRGTRTLDIDAPVTGIRVSDVCFHYPGRTRNTLDGVNLDIPAGTSLAIVGLNGAGKTTLVKLLSGLYTPTAGTIEIDGQELANLSIRDWQRHIAAIFQDFTHYYLSVADNIRLGAPDVVPTLPALLIAAEAAGALDLVAQLPAGWDTVLSRQYTNGADLSGGQWQRVALARALFAVQGGARVLILDEPSANLDVRAEAELYDRFLEMTRGLTTILISHRFSTVRRADQIVVLEEGRMVERGDHDSLLEQNGRYAEMFRLQALRFATNEPPQRAEHA